MCVCVCVCVCVFVCVCMCVCVCVCICHKEWKTNFIRCLGHSVPLLLAPAKGGGALCSLQGSLVPKSS